jgi:predicted transcriptional regulator
MQTKNIEAMRKEVVEYINDADERMVKAIHAMLEEDQNDDWWDEISEDQKASIERGLKDMEAGNVIPHADMVKLYSKWLTK